MVAFSRKIESSSIVTGKKKKSEQMVTDTEVGMVVGFRQVLFGLLLVTQRTRKQRHQWKHREFYV